MRIGLTAVPFPLEFGRKMVGSSFPSTAACVGCTAHPRMGAGCCGGWVEPTGGQENCVKEEKKNLVPFFTTSQNLRRPKWHLRILVVTTAQLRGWTHFLKTWAQIPQTENNILKTAPTPHRAAFETRKTRFWGVCGVEPLSRFAAIRARSASRMVPKTRVFGRTHPGCGEIGAAPRTQLQKNPPPRTCAEGPTRSFGPFQPFPGSFKPWRGDPWTCKTRALQHRSGRAGGRVKRPWGHTQCKQQGRAGGVRGRPDGRPLYSGGTPCQPAATSAAAHRGPGLRPVAPRCCAPLWHGAPQRRRRGWVSGDLGLCGPLAAHQ